MRTVSTPDEIAEAVLTQFDTLPNKYRPRALPEGRREWVPLAGIVVVRQYHDPPSHIHRAHTQCIALATGMKCLPRDKIPLAKGNILHDWHAEILVLRGFNRWIVDECKALTLGKESLWLQWRTNTDRETLSTAISTPFELKSDVKIHMYVSSAPCGDASMELTMAAQDDATPWTKPAPSAAPDDMPGRAHFDQLGIVRRKPSRPDAPSTWSKSCSDKLAMKQCSSLLSNLVSTLVSPTNVYLDSLVLPEPELVPAAVQRAFGKTGRLAPLAQEDVAQCWKDSGYAFRPFEVSPTRHKFAFAKIEGATSSNLAALWTPHRQEALVNGVLMGRKQFDPRGASCVSRRSLWQAVLKVAVAAGSVSAITALRKASYREVKEQSSGGRKAIKDDVKTLALQGWRLNDGDDDWALNEIP